MLYEFDTTKERSALMKKIKSTGTKPERMLAQALWHKGIRYRKNYSVLPGKPDIAITKHKVAVFVDGEFWHGYNWNIKKEKIKANRDYWIGKIEKNMERDAANSKALAEYGWLVIRFWERDVKKNIDLCVDTILNHIKGIQEGE